MLACNKGRNAAVVKNMDATLAAYGPVQSSTVDFSLSNRFCFISRADPDLVDTSALGEPALLTRMQRHFSRDSISLTSLAMSFLLVTSAARGMSSPSMSLPYFSITFWSLETVRPTM